LGFTSRRLIALSPEARPLAGFGLAFATLLAVGLIQYGSIQDLIATDGWVAHTHTVIAELEAAYSGLQLAESVTRGFVATGQQDYLAQQAAGIADSRSHLRNLQRLVADNPQQERNLDSLTRLAERKASQLQRLTELRRDRGFAEASQQLRGDEGLRLMTEVRAQADAMETVENGLLLVREAASRRRSRVANALTALGTLLALTFVLGAAWINRRDTREHQQAERALQESEAAFRTLADGVPQLVWMCTPEGLNIYFNRRWVEYTGLSLEESYGRGWNTPFHPDDKQPAWDAWNHATATGETYRVESRLRARDGAYRWFLMRGEPLRDAAERIVKWIGTCTDIEELKRSEVAIRKATEALRRANAYNRSLLEASLDPLVTISADGKITDANTAAEKITGIARQELIGTDFSDYFTDPLKARAGYQQAFREGSVQDYELEVRHREGHLRPVLYNASLYRDEAGKVMGVFAAARDITQRKRAEEAAHEQARRMREQVRLLDLTQDAIFVRDRDDRISFWNRGAEKLYGWSREEALGKTTHALLHTQFPQAFEEIRGLLLERGYWEGELAHVTRDGRQVQVASRWALQRDEAGNPVGTLEINNDITERKRAEKALKEYAAELARSNADLQQFAYVASHDLQEPLRMVGSFTQLLAKRYKGKLGDDADDFIAFAVDGARRMQALINDLLSYSRVGTRGKEFTPTNSESVLEEALANLQKAIEETGAAVTHDPLPTVWADSVQLVQLFQNLIGNALKFHGAEPPRVHISAQRRDADWRFAVRDNGIGIDPKYADRIFVIFQRLHSREEYPGAGMGLAIAKKIVERHGGSIGVESQPVKGSTFYFTIPTTRR
jgi:PAS domain S-box-containing protein